MSKNNNPVVSIVVITYNSSKYILECLDSIYNQTYENVELIISDDCSKDGTVDICREWLSEKKERFVKTELIAVEKNIGTSANCNRGIRASSGEWVKLIAGDDCLLTNCINDNVDYISNHNGINILFSKVVPIGNIEIGEKWPFLNPILFLGKLTSRQVRILLCEHNFLPAASAFFRKSVWEYLGGFDEQIPFLEDWPMWMKATNNGFVLSCMDKETVEYRFSDKSISQTQPNKSYLECNNKCKAMGLQYFHNMSLGSRFLNYTLLHASYNKFYLLLHYVNIINPFYYDYMKANKTFSEILTKIMRIEKIQHEHEF